MILDRASLCDRATDCPCHFFARNKAVRIAAFRIHDVFAAFQIVKAARLPGLTTCYCQQSINALHDFARLHFCAVAPGPPNLSSLSPKADATVPLSRDAVGRRYRRRSLGVW
ncbi:MAG: hypothetical protein Udaeo2_05530 [Candidatus Udaeobacter sp.]|nr:MAG: hypothetical protein Udaeo2_05530 [Candidatus Udaeobacter sp.]